MAKEEKRPTSGDKGKGKAPENHGNDAKNSEEIKRDEDGKPIVNGKKKDESQEGICNFLSMIPESYRG
jgi:26S proteasome regulatory subunit N1